jgi:hypothetical protein
MRERAPDLISPGSIAFLGDADDCRLAAACRALRQDRRERLATAVAALRSASAAFSSSSDASFASVLDTFCGRHAHLAPTYRAEYELVWSLARGHPVGRLAAAETFEKMRPAARSREARCRYSYDLSATDSRGMGTWRFC